MTGHRWKRSVAAIAGAVLGAGVVLAWGDIGRPLPPEDTIGRLQIPNALPPSPETTGAPLDQAVVLLAWAPGALPPTAERAARSTDGVDDATTLISALDWITLVVDRTGAVIDRPDPGYRIPFDVASVEPAEYADYVPPGERDLIATLGPGEILLSRTSAKLRGGGAGMRLRFGTRVLRVTGVVSDEAAQGYEGLIGRPIPRDWGRTHRFLLIRAEQLTARDAVERRLRRLLGGATPLRVRAFGETPFLRYGDAVLPQMLVKDTFGEFAARPREGGAIDIEPSWRSENIVTMDVPVLGRMTCHRLLLRQAREALRDLQRIGAADGVERSQFAGCFNARFIGRDPQGRLSHHSWGIAFDLNALENPTGAEPRLDQDIVQAFERHGFTWGGRWLVPDGMHFEWVRFT